MISATDMRAMRKAIERLEGVDRIRDLEIRRAMAPNDSTVRLAVEIANQGGRATTLDFETHAGLAGLLSSGWLHWPHNGRGWELDAVLLAEFAQQVLQ